MYYDKTDKQSEQDIERAPLKFVNECDTANDDMTKK